MFQITKVLYELERTSARTLQTEERYSLIHGCGVWIREETLVTTEERGPLRGGTGRYKAEGGEKIAEQ